MPYALDGNIDFYGRYVQVHPIPFSGGTTDDEKAMTKAQAKALAEIDYNGYITLESDCVYDQMPLDIVPYMAKYMCEAAKKLGRMVEDYKKELKK